jgi:hypothetical protein
LNRARKRRVFSQQGRREIMIVKDKRLKKKLDKVPDVDKQGDPIYKIEDIKKNTKPKRKGPNSK